MRFSPLGASLVGAGLFVSFQTRSCTVVALNLALVRLTGCRIGSAMAGAARAFVGRGGRVLGLGLLPRPLGGDFSLNLLNLVLLGTTRDLSERFAWSGVPTAGPTEASTTHELSFSTRRSDLQNQQLCRGYLEDYGVLPQESWGTAPKDVQDDWMRKVSPQPHTAKGRARHIPDDVSLDTHTRYA